MGRSLPAFCVARVPGEVSQSLVIGCRNHTTPTVELPQTRPPKSRQQPAPTAPSSSEARSHQVPVSPHLPCSGEVSILGSEVTTRRVDTFLSLTEQVPSQPTVRVQFPHPPEEQVRIPTRRPRRYIPASPETGHSHTTTSVALGRIARRAKTRTCPNPGAR